MVTGGEDSISTGRLLWFKPEISLLIVDDAGIAELAIDDDKSTAVVTDTPGTHDTRAKVRDITPQFTDASSGPSQKVTSLSGPADTLHYHVALKTGQLVKDESFTLFEAVGALEIMDPKMDNGYLAPGETLEDEYDVTKPLLPHEIIGIMDQLLCHEEEDFVTHLYNRSLLTEIPETELFTLMDEALWWLEKNEARAISDRLRDALKTRLRFRKAFLGAVSKDLGIIKDPSTIEWETCAKHLQLIGDSHCLGKPVERSFSVKIQRKLASTVPPRPMVNISFENALMHLKRLCQDGTDLVAVLDFRGSNDLMTFIWTFQSRKPQPSVYVRALLQTLLCSEDVVLGKISVKQLLYYGLAEIVLPADILLDSRNWGVEHPRDRRFQIRKRMDEFATRAGHSYIDIFRAICQNRSRIRRTLCHTLRDWESLQMDAEELDNELRPFTGEEPIVNPTVSPEPIFAFPLSSWAYYHKLKQMEWVIQLGFELQIYQPDELLGMYCYLQQIVQTRIQHLERIRGFVTRKLNQLSPSADDAETQKEEITRSLAFLNFSMLEASATQTFSGAMSSFYSALHQLHFIDSPPRPYSTDALRYEIRMKPFLHIGLPELIPYEDFRAFVIQPQDSAPRLLNAAASAIARLRKDYELMGKMDSVTTHSVLCQEWWTKNLKDSLRAGIATGIAIATLLKVVEATGWPTDKDRLPMVKVDLTQELSAGGQGGYHPFWIVPKIIERVK